MRHRPRGSNLPVTFEAVYGAGARVKKTKPAAAEGDRDGGDSDGDGDGPEAEASDFAKKVLSRSQKGLEWLKDPTSAARLWAALLIMNATHRVSTWLLWCQGQRSKAEHP